MSKTHEMDKDGNREEQPPWLLRLLLPEGSRRMRLAFRLSQFHRIRGFLTIFV